MYREHNRPVYRYLIRRGVEAASVDDACAEVFLVAWRRRHDMPTQTAKVRPWLLGVARNVAFDDFRSMMRWESHPAEQFEGGD